MNKSELQEILYGKLTEFLSPMGFKYQKKFDWFLRKTPSGFQTVGSAIVHQNLDFILTPVLTIRLDAVSEILARFLQVAKGYENALVTLTANYHIVSSKSFFNNKVASVDQLQECSSGIIRFLEEAGLPFLDAHSNVDALDKLVNQNPLAPSPYLAYALHRAMIGIILAKLNKRDSLAELIQQYRSAIAAVLPPERQRFEDLVLFLETI